MKPVFIQSWTIQRKCLLSANLSKAMPQMLTMKMSDFYQKRLTAQEIMMHLPIVAFPLFLQTNYIRNIVVVWKVSCFSSVFISLGKTSLSIFLCPIFRRMTHIINLFVSWLIDVLIFYLYSWLLIADCYMCLSIYIFPYLCIHEFTDACTCPFFFLLIQ